MNYPAAAFVDITNLYYSLKESSNRRVDYTQYIAWLRENFDLRFAKAYCNQDANSFQRMLQAIGFEVLSGKYTYAYELIMDALEVSKNCDTIIIGSTNVYVPSLAKRLKAMGKRVIIFAANIPKEYSVLGSVYSVENILLPTPGDKPPDGGPEPTEEVKTAA